MTIKSFLGEYYKISLHMLIVGAASPEKGWVSEDSLRDLWDNIKCTNIWIIGVPEEEKKKGYEKFFIFFIFF